MTAFDIPADLVAAQKAFLDSEKKCERISAAMPAPTAIAAQEAEISDEQRQAMAEAREVRHACAAAVRNHAWWQTVEPEKRIAAQNQLRKAAAD